MRLRRNVEKIRRILDQGPDSRTRLKLVGLLDQSRRLADPYFCWKAATRDNGISGFAVTHVRQRGLRAKVYFTLRLKNGRSVRETESLVRRKGRWLIG